MALIEFKRGLQANLPAIGEDGVFYLTSDSNRLYAGIGDNKAPQLLNQTVQIVDKVDSLPVSANINDFYYCTAENILAIYTGKEKGWVQINPDTGAIGIETEGEGNAITAISYNPSNRKLTYTLGETFATAEELNTFKSYVGTYPADEVDEEGNKKYSNIIDYIIKVASGNSSESAASVKQQLDTYKEETNSIIDEIGQGLALTSETANNTTKLANTNKGRIDELVEDVQAIDNIITKIANPMIYKGVVNSDAELIAKEANIEPGHTYMVGTTGTYDDKEAEQGDLFIWADGAWTYIPAGDDAEIDTTYDISFNSGNTISLRNLRDQSTQELEFISDSLIFTQIDTHKTQIEVKPLEWGTF